MRTQKSSHECVYNKRELAFFSNFHNPALSQTRVILCGAEFGGNLIFMVEVPF